MTVPQSNPVPHGAQWGYGVVVIVLIIVFVLARAGVSPEWVTAALSLLSVAVVGRQANDTARP